MKQLIHIDIPDEEGNSQCFERQGGFFVAVSAFWAIWRYGIGRITIGEEDDTEEVQSDDVTTKIS